MSEKPNVSAALELPSSGTVSDSQWCRATNEGSSVAAEMYGCPNYPWLAKSNHVVSQSDVCLCRSCDMEVM